jgi:hypothetical protein
MYELKEMLEVLKAMGVKVAGFSDDGRVQHVEFFPAAPSIPALDLDTLVPPADEGDDRPAVSIPPPVARILRKPSVS